MSNYINKISGRALKIFAAIAVIVSFTIIYKTDAHAESFTHVHTNECYETGKALCRNHTISCEVVHQQYHCNTCGTMRDFTEFVYYDVCKSGIVDRELRAFKSKCNTCGTYRMDQNPGDTRVHYYNKKELVCGKDDSTPIANIGISASSTAPTNGSVTLSVSVSDTAPEFALSDAPYNFGAGNTSSSSFEVNENGTYSATVTDSLGRSVTVSCTVNNIDKTNPVIDSISKDTEDWSESGVTITVNAHDEGLGLAGEAYSFNGEAFGTDNTFHVNANGNVSVKVKDVAGNIAEDSINIANVGRDPKVVEAERKEAERKAAAEKAAAEKAAAEKAAAEKAAKDKAAADKTAAEKAAADKAAADKAAAEKAMAEQAAKEKASKSDTVDDASKKATKTTDNGTGSKSSNSKTDKKGGKTTATDESPLGHLKDTAASGGAIANGTVLNGLGGKLISVRDVTKAEADAAMDEFKEEVIESVYDVDYDSVEDDDDDDGEVVVSGEDGNRGEGITLLKASMGDYTVPMGILLLLAGALIISQFSYVYVMQGGKKRLICRCRILKAQDGIIAVVPGNRLTSHGKYMLYVSPWKKGFKKKVPVSVMLEGEDSKIPTDEGVSFKY